MKSKIGIVLAGTYILLAFYLISTQGLFGESFIALILGIPWSFIFSFFEFWQAEGYLLGLLLIVPMILNSLILYCMGKSLERALSHSEKG